MLTNRELCSYFVHMDDSAQTFGEAASQNMLLRVECTCGQVAYFMARDAAKFWGNHRKVSQHRFKCKRCTPPAVTVTLVPIDVDRMPRGYVTRLRAGGAAGDPEWRREKFRG